MATQIYPIRLGFDCCYVIRDQGAVLIDAGVQGQAGRFERTLERLGLRPGDIQLLVITHGHFDHVGSAKRIRDLTGAKIAMHLPDARWLEQSIHPRIHGVTPWGRFIAEPLNWHLPFMRFEPAPVDILLDDTDQSLNDYGIRGKIVFTPGHTAGSVSVLLEGGEAFVGDLAMNRIPLRLSPGPPVLAENMRQVMESWGKLLSAGARVIYPAHGRPFSAGIMAARS